MTSKKHIWKKIDKKCALCGEADFCLLDTHRIVFGGEYSRKNTLTICTTCHRRIHAGKINILGKRPSTAGEVIHFTEDGEEKFNLI